MATIFEWDEAKALANLAKHGVSFELAQHAYPDPRCLMAEDLDHSEQEQRYFCFGRVGDNVITVRFTWRAAAFASSAPATGAKAERRMKKRTVKYTEGEIGRFRIVENFLPPPDQLVLRESNVKVTLSLSRKSVDFFKREAKKGGVPYQRMIRALVDAYAEKARS